MTLQLEQLHETTVTRMTEYLLLPMKMPEQAQVALVFGNPQPHAAYLALSLWLERRVTEYICVTGGTLRENGHREALNNYDILKEFIEEGYLLVEPQAHNTFENVKFSLLILKEYMPSLRSLVICCSWYHARRCVMSIKRFTDDIQIYLSYYFPNNITPENWHQSSEGRRAVLHEIKAIPLYLKKGDLAVFEEEREFYC